jgi:hypothetical protein
MAQRLVANLSPRRTGFAPGSVHVGFVVDKAALGQGFLRVLRFPLSLSFHCGSPCSYITWGMNKRPVGGRSSETSSNPIDMNNYSRVCFSVDRIQALFVVSFILNEFFVKLLRFHSQHHTIKTHGNVRYSFLAYFP